MKPTWSAWMTVGGGLLSALPAAADVEHVCRLGETIRRIEIRYGDASGRPPCDVVYTKETERPGVEETLWSATSDVGFCRSKADGLAELLEDNGWRCSGGDATATGLVDAQPPEDADRPGPQEPPVGDDAVAALADAPLPPPERPDAIAAAAPAAGGANAADPDRVVDEPGPQAALPEESSPPAKGPDEEPDEEPDGVGGVFIPAEALEAAVERDLARLKKSADDAVEASVGWFGDLNDDDVEDAAVLITFDADGADHAQYLVAYVAEEGTFRPAASRFIGGRYRKIFGADVEAIEAGRIRLQLKVLQPEDAYCCPSGVESAQFVLRNGELVEAP